MASALAHFISRVSNSGMWNRVPAAARGPTPSGGCVDSEVDELERLHKAVIRKFLSGDGDFHCRMVGASQAPGALSWTWLTFHKPSSEFAHWEAGSAVASRKRPASALVSIPGVPVDSCGLGGGRFD